MDVESLRSFLMWCTLINGALLVFWGAWIMAAPDFVYEIQKKFVPITKEFFQCVMYSFLGLFKILWIFFNVVPYLVLLLSS